MKTVFKTNSFWLLHIVLLFFIRAKADSLTLFRPQIGVPEFTEPGGVFRAEVKAGFGLSSNQWSITLANELRTWTNCALEQVSYGAYVDNTSCTGYQLTIRVPTNLPPELFRLGIGHLSEGAATNRHAVSIVPRLETNFYILHYADPQASASNALSASGANTPYGSIQEMYWHAPVFSLINPRFIFDTGDEIDDGNVDTVNRYAQYVNAIDQFGAPLLISRGNNDRGDFGHWKTNIGPTTFSITMGSFYVCMKDYNSNTSADWFQNDYSNSFRNTNITFHLFGQHYNSGGYAFSPTSGQYPDLMLVGHNHSFDTLQSSPYYVLSSGPAFRYGGVSLFSFYKSGTNWLCPGRTNHPGGTQFTPVLDWGIGKVVCAYSFANNGTAFTNTALITNSLAFDFWDGRVRFLMNKARGGYKVVGGSELAEYDYGNGTNTAVLVRVNIASNALTTVSVCRTDSDEDGMPDDWELANFTNLARSHDEFRLRFGRTARLAGIHSRDPADQ